MLVQDGKLAHVPPWWNDVVRDARVCVLEENLAHTSFSMGGMIFFEMCLYLC
jgi:hypothetical protein